MVTNFKVTLRHHLIPNAIISMSELFSDAVGYYREKIIYKNRTMCFSGRQLPISKNGTNG